MMPLSLTGRRWQLKRSTSFASMDSMLATLASERGLSDIGAATRATLSDPMLFPEMGRAVDRIRSAIEKRETIAIFGDYDADGITGTAQLVRFFRRHGVEPIPYLPHRMKEGYGLKNESIDQINAKGTTLIITVDTGIAAHAQIAHANRLGIDVIVTDHHHPSGGRPPAYAVIHPQIPSPFPNPNLCGSGVAFMLVRALENDDAWEGIREDFALAAIGTIADLVSLTGENRILVTHGLKFLQNLPAGPLRDFADAIRPKTGAISSTDVAFRLVPRINASGRMDDPAIALDALLSGGDALALLHQLNTERQTATADLYEDAQQMVDLQQALLTVCSTRFTAGLVGLIAGKLTQQYGRPSLVAAISGDMCTGSLRSVPQVDIMQMLTHAAVQPLLLTFGGHAQAAGCTFKTTDFAAVSSALNQAMAEHGFRAEALQPTLLIESVMAPPHLSTPLLDALRTLEPFGNGNEEPVFLLESQTIGDMRCVGTDGKHLQCRIAGKKAIGFSLGHCGADLRSDDRYDIACRFGLDSWNGRNDIQVMIEDIRPVVQD